MQAFGLPFSEGIHESDADLVTEPEETAPAVEPEPAAQPTPVETAPEADAGEEYEDEYSEMLARVRQASDDSEEKPETDPVAAGDAAVRERLAHLEGRLRTYDPAPAAPAEAPPAQQEEEGIDYSDPAVSAALAQALSNPSTAGPTIKTLVQMEAKNLIKKDVGEIKEQVEKVVGTAQQDREFTERKANLQRGLQAAYQLGGLEAAVVMEAEEKGTDSLLYQYLELNPHLSQDPKGIVTATLAVSRAVQKADEKLDQSADQKKAPTPVGTRRQTVASKRGRNLTTPQEEQSIEEKMKSEITSTAKPAFGLPFMK